MPRWRLFPRDIHVYIALKSVCETSLSIRILPWRIGPSPALRARDRGGPTARSPADSTFATGSWRARINPECKDGLREAWPYGSRRVAYLPWLHELRRIGSR